MKFADSSAALNEVFQTTVDSRQQIRYFLVVVICSILRLLQGFYRKT